MHKEGLLACRLEGIEPPTFLSADQLYHLALAQVVELFVISCHSVFNRPVVSWAHLHKSQTPKYDIRIVFNPQVSKRFTWLQQQNGVMDEIIY